MINNPRAYEQSQWLERARCAEYGSPTMFPGEGDRHGIRLAKDVCARCPVRAECLDGALKRGEQWGVWGGLTAEERKALKRKQARERAREQDGIKDVHLPDVA